MDADTPGEPAVTRLQHIMCGVVLAAGFYGLVTDRIDIGAFLVIGMLVALYEQVAS